MKTLATTKIPTLSASPVFLERLEDRIAPASLSGDGKTVTFTDVDGDSVSVKFSQPLANATAAADAFKFSGSNFSDTGPQTLDTIDLTKFGLNAETAKKFTIEVKTKKGESGDGVTNIGDIVATGLDLKKIKVSGGLRSVVAGDADTTTQAVGVIEIGSLGGDGTVNSTLSGGVDIMKIRGNVTGHVDITATGGKNSAEKIEIGGKLVGGSTTNSGTLTLGGSIKILKIAEGIDGGTGESSGALIVNGDVTQFLEIGGTRGGAGDSSGTATVTGSVGGASLGDVQGGTGQNSGVTTINGNIKKGSAGNISGDGMGSGKLIVGSFGTIKMEDILGGDDNSGVFSAIGGGKSLRISDLNGGDGDDSGIIETGAPIGNFLFSSINGGDGNHTGCVTIAAGDFNGDSKDDILTVKGGNINGGNGEASGVFTSFAGTRSFTAENITGNGAKNGGGVSVAAGDFNGDGTLDRIASVKVNNIVGGSAQGSGFFTADGINSFTCTNIFGGTGIDSGAVLVNGDVSKFVVTLDLQALQGGAGAGAIMINGNANLVKVNGARGGDLFVHGNLKKFTNKFGVYQGSSGGFDMFVDQNLGSAVFGGPIFYGQIFAGGDSLDPSGGIGMVQVNGDATGLGVFAGFTNSTTAVNPNASIGSVKILGNGNSCSFWAGVQDTGNDGIPDAFIGGATTSNSVIESVIFQPRSGVSGVTIFCPEIEKAKLAKGYLALILGPGNDNITDENGNKVVEIGGE